MVTSVLFHGHWTMALATLSQDLSVMSVSPWDPQGGDTPGEAIALAAAKDYISTWWGVESVKQVQSGPSFEDCEEFTQPSGDESSCGICVAAAALSVVTDMSLDGDVVDWVLKMRAFLGAGIADHCLPLV